MDEAANDSAVDGSGNEDDGQTNAKGNLGDKVASRQQSGRLDVDSYKGVNNATGDGVDSNLDEAKSPDGLLVVSGSMHLVHE